MRTTIIGIIKHIIAILIAESLLCLIFHKDIFIKGIVEMNWILILKLFLCVLVFICLWHVLNFINNRKIVKINSKLTMFWMFLEELNKDFMDKFVTKGETLYHVVSAFINHLNADPVLKNILIDNYEPLTKIDFSKNYVDDFDTARKYWNIIFNMMLNNSLKDNLITKLKYTPL